MPVAWLRAARCATLVLVARLGRRVVDCRRRESGKEFIPTPSANEGLPCVLQAVLQQLRLVYRSHKAKRKADVLYDQPVGASNVSTAILYPTQHAVGEAARQQWSQVQATPKHQCSTAMDFLLLLV